MKLDRILGPKIPADLSAEQPRASRRPIMLFSAAALLLAISVVLPYWTLRLTAPQYPQGLTVNAYVNRLEGDVGELEALNHYIGATSFSDAATFERSVAVVAILTLAGLLLAGLFIHSRWVLLVAAPAVLFPLFFMIDLQFWLWRFGHDLDPLAPFAGAVGEFTPPLFGPAKIAQFETLALPHFGLIAAIAAATLTALGLWHHRKVYKPLIASRAAE